MPNPEQSQLSHAQSGRLKARLQQYVPCLIWGIAILVMLAIPVRIIVYGYLPTDDALRHAAKAVSGKAWHDVLIIREGFGLDHNPGWHAILGWVHGAGLGTDGLVAFSIAVLFLGVGASVFPWVRRPEAWLAALLVASLASDHLMLRLFQARPLLLTMAIVTTLLFAWTRRAENQWSTGLLLATTGLIALSTWVHGTWYLLALPVAAFALAGRFRQAAVMGACWLAGAFLGAALTGHPFDYLFQNLRHAAEAFGQHTVERLLVVEFQSSRGDRGVVAAIAIMVILAKVTGRRLRLLQDPAFVLLVLCWILGFKVMRFWLDWGMPALFVWLTCEMQVLMEGAFARNSGRRLGVAASLGAALYLMMTADTDGRWTRNLTTDYLTPDDEEVQEWLPADGGIIYSANMRVFYLTFFKNPEAGWKYILGFEPAFMPLEDLATLRRIQWNLYASKAYLPWLAKMRPEDRLVIMGHPGSKPDVPGLEWAYPVSGYWVGRLPRETNATRELRTAPAIELKR